MSADNSFDSNITRKLARIFLNAFESTRSLSKSVNTQLLEGKFDPSSGTTVDFKRPTDYTTKRTTDGDVSALAPSPIITGKATGTVQDYFTVDLEWTAIDQALKMDQLEQLIAPAATRIVTDLETDFALFMLENGGLSIGDPDTAVTTWQQVADAGALMSSLGIPPGDWTYAINPFTQAKLADAQRSLGAGGAAGEAVMTALEMATLTRRFAGFERVIAVDSLQPLTTNAITDRAGSLSAAPDVTYATAKDTMKQTWAVTGFTASLAVKAGEQVEVTGRNMINLSTKKTFLDNSGAQLKYRGTVTADVTLNGSGAGNLSIAGPAIFESDGAYNTSDTALAASDVVTLLGTGSTTYQPNLFFHRDAYGIGAVPQEKLYATDTIATTEDGLQIRCSKFADGRANKQMVRFDLLPAYSVLNPFFGGQGHG
jgi:hypothetical protein